MASYPSTIYSPRTKANRSGVVYDAAKETVIFVEDTTKLEDEVVALETDLEARKYSITIIIDGGGSAITTGEKGHLEIPFACEIERVTLLADVSGSIVVNIWKDTYANFPPAVGDKITADAPPTITTAVKSQDATLTGWTKTIAAGDILAFNVDSAATVTRVTLALKIKKT
jgi:hypothetical protein